MYPTLHILNFQLSTYFVVISISICLAILFGKARADRRQLNTRLVLDLGILSLVVGLLGSRLFHILFEEPLYYLENPLKAFAFQDGGYVFFGGFLFGLTFWVCACLYKKISIPQMFDCLWAPTALGYGLGRMGCFLAGCCYGTYCRLPWSVGGRHPTQLYAVAWELVVLLTLLRLEKLRVFSKQGQIAYLWLGLHGLGRLIMENFRADFRGPEWGLSISSWISLGIILASGLLLIRSYYSDKSTAK